MAITSVVIEDTPDHTVTRTTDTVLGSVVDTWVPKVGSPAANVQALQALAAGEIAKLNTAETMLTQGTFDSLTANARTAIIVGLVRQNRALIRLVLGLTDAAS